jgi:hypothetical protein
MGKKKKEHRQRVAKWSARKNESRAILHNEITRIREQLNAEIKSGAFDPTTETTQETHSDAEVKTT